MKNIVLSLGMPTNPPLDLLPRLIAKAMAEEPTRLCANCDTVPSNCKCHPDDAEIYDVFPLREAVVSYLFNTQHWAVDGIAELLELAGKSGAHANVEPRHLAALWEACAELIADSEESNVQR